jgi:hypothetical protein
MSSHRRGWWSSRRAEMCQYKVKLTGPAEVDAELITWIRRAYDAAG